MILLVSYKHFFTDRLLNSEVQSLDTEKSSKFVLEVLR